MRILIMPRCEIFIIYYSRSLLIPSITNMRMIRVQKIFSSEIRENSSAKKAINKHETWFSFLHEFIFQYFFY